MDLNEIISKLSAAKFTAKLSRDGSHVVVSCGNQGFFRVRTGSTHPHAVNGVHIENFSKFGRAVAMSQMDGIRQAIR